MNIPADSHSTAATRIWRPNSSHIVQWLGIITAGLGVLALIGWYTGDRRLAGFNPRYIPMAPNTAILFLLVGISLCGLSTKHPRVLAIIRFVTLPMALLAGLRLLEILASLDLRLDRWFFNTPPGMLGLAPLGKMSFPTALGFIASSAALLLSTLSRGRRVLNDLAIFLATVTTFIGLIFLLGYFYGAPLLYGGSTIPMAINTALAFFLAGVAIEINNIGFEIRARRMADEALRKAYDELELRVKERTAALSLAHQALNTELAEKKSLEQQLLHSQKMEAIGRLAGGIAHDFNNLLTIINGYGEMLLQQFNPDDPRHKTLEEIHKAGMRAVALTCQLLAFSRRQILQPRILNLNDVVTNLEAMLRRLIGEDVEIALHLQPHLENVNADPGQIEQVLINLAVNARDAMPRGGQISIETRDVAIDEAVVQKHFGIRPGRYVVISMTDTGSGMDDETLTHIFEPFFTTKELGKGTGLGLSMVYGIIKQSGGHIWVYSEKEKGTTFKIYLPSVKGPSEVSPAPLHSNGASGGTETILLVEDEVAVRHLTRDVLEQSGYKVLESTDGDEAVRLCQNCDGPIHLLLTDVVMPKKGGRELAEQLGPLRPEMRVLFVSGYTDDAIVRYGLLRKGAAFLQKPFTPTTLAWKVREVLDASQKETKAEGRKQKAESGRANDSVEDSMD